MYCPNCGASKPDATSTCLNCGQPPTGRSAPATAFCRTHPNVPAASPCGRCGTFFCASCLTAVGGQWLCAACRAKGTALPWDERERLGLWRAWWQTSVAMISRPTQTLQTAQPDAPLGESLLFSVLAMLVGLGPTLAVYGVIFAAVGFGGGLPKGGFDLPAWAVPLIALVYLVLLLLFQVLGVLMTAGMDHVALMVLGGNPRPYSVSVRASAIAMGPYLLGLVPVCGLYVFPLWAIVLRILALMHFHQVSGGKATAAVLAPLALLCGACGLLYAAIFAVAGLGALGGS